MSLITGKTIKSIIPLNDYGICGGLRNGCIMTFTDDTYVTIEIGSEADWIPNSKVLSISEVHTI